MERLYGVKKDTAYRICSLRQYNANPRGGTKGKKMDAESIAFILNKVELRPDITLLELKDALREETGLTVSISTIARCLEGQLINMKKLELIPSNRNCELNKQARREHSIWLQQQHESGARFCYVDECGHGLYTARTRGRSVIGQPARRIADNQRTPHITLLCAITPSLGLIHSKMIIGGAKQGDFDGFISELFQLNFGPALEISEGVTKQYIILDNAPCHREYKIG